MIQSLPEHIISHILEELPPYTGLLVIHANSKGNMLSWHGPWNRYFDDEAKPKADLTQFIPFLSGLFPLPEKTLQLQNLQLKDKLWIDIHLLKDDDQSHWIFLTDRTKEAIKLQGLLQKVNEDQFRLESLHHPDSGENPFGHLYLFQVATFEKLNNDQYRLTGSAPKWLNNLKPQLSQKEISIHLTEIFPFLEIFISEMSEEDVFKTRNFFNSGIWIESDTSGKEYFLRAFSTKINDTEFLLIRLLNDDLLGEQDTIQKAREQQLAYEKLAKAKKQLQELLDYKDKFVSIITHDLRSPVASVLGATEMFINDTEFMSQLDAFNKEMLFSMRDEMNRMLDYNDKLYHWSNLELGNFELTLETIEMADLIKTITKTFKGKFEEKKIQFSSVVPTGYKIKVDITLFLQVLNNLIGNALKFTPEGGNISVEVSLSKNHNQIIVSDSGIGMDEERAARLFDNSYAKSTQGTKGEKGTGLGLGIVKRIIQAHHFSIRAHSKPGKGTQMIIEL